MGWLRSIKRMTLSVPSTSSDLRGVPPNLSTEEGAPMAPRTVPMALPKHRARFRYLFFVQLTLLTLFPYLERAGLPAVLFRLFGAIAFFTAVYAVSDRRVQWVTALLLAIPTGIFNVVFAMRPSSGIEIPTLALTILFLSYTLVSLLRAVLRGPRVTSDTIYGAISVYLLMAIVWGVAYLLLETLQPGSLSVDTVRHPALKIDWFDCIFYSF